MPSSSGSDTRRESGVAKAEIRLGVSITGVIHTEPATIGREGCPRQTAIICEADDFSGLHGVLVRNRAFQPESDEGRCRSLDVGRVQADLRCIPISCFLGSLPVDCHHL